MEQSNTSGPRIRVLADHVAKIIAAGEVIDRPFSVVRELIDNSLDAGASEITLETERGGIDSILISDNGVGMGEEDLALCYLPHATSKIVSEDDIYNIKTLGFRGEALSSIGTCSKLEITSVRANDSHGHKLVIHGGRLISLEDIHANKGTLVWVRDLFYNMPARKKFQKTPSGEQAMCKAVLLDKALPFSRVSFRFFAEKELRLFLPESSAIDRVATAYPESIPPGSIFEETLSDDGFSIRAILGRPEVTRKDRKLIQIFVNRRRIYDYSLVQAIDYGYSGYIPGKDNPVAFVFIEIEPGLVDFNVHPAKKECRIRNQAGVHQALVRLVKGFASRFSISMNKVTDSGEESDLPTHPVLDGLGGASDRVYGTNASSLIFKVNQGEDQYGTDPRAPRDDGSEVRYIGQAFDLFLVAEYRDTLYMIDQHAAHEKIIFEKLNAEKPVAQELLFPFSFDATSEEVSTLGKNADLYRDLGIRIEATGKDSFEITALPAYLVSGDYEEIVRTLVSCQGRFEDISHSLIAMAACRAAVKEGEKLDAITAVNLIREAFKLENARCPHGRPLWFAINKDELYTLLGRK